MKVYLVNCLTLNRSNQKVTKSYSIQLAPHESLGKRVRSEGPLLDRTPVSKNMPLFTAPLTSQRLEEICSRAPPTHQAGNTPPQGVARPPGGQRPISLEYQIYLPTIDTIVTGMVPPGSPVAEETTSGTSLLFFITPSISSGRNS